jgi:hypothetical protein
MGHGDFDRHAGRGVLLLEQEDGSADPVDSDRLRMLLGDESSLRLVFVNACMSGTTASQATFDPFAGIAASLIRIGVPAVVAMQFPISDRGAINFADTFYHRIADGYPVDAAVNEARKALWDKEDTEWATPVLFMRSSDGMLFQPATGPKPIDTTVARGASPGGTAGRTDSPAASEPAQDPRVFLAAPSDQLRPAHRQLVAALKSAGIRVASDVPPPFDDKEHTEAVRDLVRRSDVCVHLLGDRPGEPIDLANQSRTYTLEQLGIALESARSQLVLMPEQVDASTIEDPSYAQLVRSLSERSRESDRFELVRTGIHQMRDEVLAKLQRLDQARQHAQHAVGGQIETAFVDMHVSDFKYATDLVNYLNERRIMPIMMPAGASAPSAAVALFEQNLQKVPLFLVVFGSVAREWVLGRLTAAARVMTTHSVRARIGVYIAPPEKNAELLRFPPFYDVAANMTRFDPSTLDALIERASETTT